MFLPIWTKSAPNDPAWWERHAGHEVIENRVIAVCYADGRKPERSTNFTATCATCRESMDYDNKPDSGT